jgi:hypothetical protein
MNKLYEENDIHNIANAIRSKNGLSDKYTVSQMASAIANIPQGGDGGITPSGEITLTENGRFDVTQYANAIVNVATGGGSGSSDLPSNVKSGVLHLETDATESITIEHGCGVLPRVITCFPLDNIEIKRSLGGVCAESVSVGFSSNDDGTKAFSTAAIIITNVTEVSFDFVPRSAAYPLAGECNYLWTAIY